MVYIFSCFLRKVILTKKIIYVQLKNKINKIDKYALENIFKADKTGLFFIF